MGVEVAVLKARPTSPDNNGQSFNLGPAKSGLVAIIAVHYGIELVRTAANADILIQMGLSSNPEHEDVGAGDFDEMTADKAVYGKATLQSNHDGAGDSTATRWSHEVPCYGLVRPRRQIWVWSILNETAATGLWVELWYLPFDEASAVEVDYINQTYGKYRRA